MNENGLAGKTLAQHTEVLMGSTPFDIFYIFAYIFLRAKKKLTAGQALWAPDMGEERGERGGGGRKGHFETYDKYM